MIDWNKSYSLCKRGWKQGMPETSCGGGATIESSQGRINWLSTFIKAKNIQSIVDIGCGDFNWMSQVGLGAVEYTGYDWILDPATYAFTTPTTKFIECNAATHPIEKADLVICRSVMIHLSTNEALVMLSNILNSVPKFLLITSFDVPDNNRTLHNYAPLNLELPPFNLCNPIDRIDTKGNKYLNLYQFHV